MAENYSAFEGLNLNDARSKNETREEYKKRLKQNRQVIKIYNKVGREAFQQMFPEGVSGGSGSPFWGSGGSWRGAWSHVGRKSSTPWFVGPPPPLWEPCGVRFWIFSCN